MDLNLHLVRGEVPQTGQGGPHQLSEGGVGALPASADTGQEGEGGQEAHNPHDNLRADEMSQCPM